MKNEYPNQPKAGARLSRAITRKGHTTKTFAEQQGVTHATVKREAGGQVPPTVTRWLEMARALGVTIEQILTGKKR